MPFIAECLFCHAKVRVPDGSAGRSVNCPRCGDWFTLAPMEKQPEVPAAGPRPAPAAAAAAAVLASVDQAEAEEAEATASSDKSKPAPDPEPWREPWTFPYELLGAVALVLAGAAAATAPVPGYQVYSTGLAGLAVGVGLIGWLAAAKPDRGGRAKPAVGTCLGAALVVLNLVFPDLIRGGPPFGDNIPRPLGRDVATPGSEERIEDPDAGGAARNIFRLGAIQIRVAAAETVQVKLVGKANAPAPDRLLQITMRVFNGRADQPLTYYSWSQPMPGEKTCTATLHDDQGKSYGLSSFGPARTAGAPLGTRVAPGSRVDEVLTFDVPPAAGTHLHLELPLAAVGGTGTLRLAIPRSAIVHR